MVKVYEINGVTPVVDPTAYVHPSAVLIGDVIVGPRCYIGPLAALLAPGRSAAISVGTNPTFDDVEARQVEAHVLDETSLDLYGHRVQVQFTHRIRGMVAFEGIPALIDQMTQDVTRVRTVLA